MDRTLIISKHEMVVDRDYFENLEEEVKKLKKLMLTKEKLENLAYKAATGSVTTRIMTKKQWEKCNTSSVLWEPLDGYGNDFTEDLVSEIASSIIKNFASLIKDK